MSNQLPSNSKKDIDLNFYANTDQILLPANDISDHIMPGLLLHFSRSLNDVLKIQDEGINKVDTYDDLEKILSDLIEVGDTFKSLQNIEKVFNKQLKALLIPYVDRIGKLKEEMLKESQRISQNESTPEDYEKEEKEAELQDAMDILAAKTMADQLSEIKIKVLNLKETLSFVPKVPLTGHDPGAISDADAAPASLQSVTVADDDADADAVTALVQSEESLQKEEAEKRVVESVSGDFFKNIQKTTHFEEIISIYNNLNIPSYTSYVNENLKRSLLCLSIFPDGSVIKKRAIINWWIGENLLEIPGGSIGELEVGDKFFEHLISKGFLEPVLIKNKPLVKRCRMHSFTRLMVIPLAQEFIKFDSSGTLVVESFSKAFLIKTERGPSQYAIRNSSKLKEIESLFNINESKIDIQKHWFSKVKNLKVLQLGKWSASQIHPKEVADSEDNHIEVANIDFLRQLSNMQELRYLSLHGVSRISEIPVSFSNLINLKILDLKACHDLRKVPSGIGCLKKLMILDMSECYFIDQMPKEISLLTELQVLKGFLINENPASNVCKLEDLENLRKLKKLSIYAGGKTEDIENQLIHLRKFKELRLLSIAWVGVPSSKSKNDGMMRRFMSKTLTMKNTFVSRNAGDATSRRSNYEVQQNYLNLEKLELMCIPLGSIPEWLVSGEPSNLKKLYIRGGKLRDLRGQNYTWGTVEILRLKYLAELEMNWRDLKAAFPKMNYLEKVKCPKLSFFPCDHTGAWTRSSK